MKHAQFLSTLMIVLALCGCSAANGGSHTTASHSPTKDGDGTVAQWASVVAEQKANLEAWKQKWDEETCSVSPTLSCSIQTLTGTFVTQTVDISLKIPETKTALKGYIGTPPSEIRSLYQDTLGAAAETESAGKAWSDTCSAAASGSDCDSLLFKFSSAIDSLESKFQAWAPYLG